MDELERIKREKLIKMLAKSKGMTEEVDDNNFEEKVLKQSETKPVVVDFWASWCMPCTMLSPILDKLAEEYKGKFVLAKVNVDQAKASAMKYGIMSIPSVKLFKDGKVVDEFVGVQPEPMIKGWLDKNLK